MKFMEEKMISSIDEAVLLLRKWKSESARVKAFLSLAGINLFLTGEIKRVDSERLVSFVLVPDNPADLLMVTISGCDFGYRDDLPLPEPLGKHLPSNWDSLLFVRFVTGSRLALFAVEDSE